MQLKKGRRLTIQLIVSVFFSGKCSAGDLCFTMLEQFENIDTKLNDYGDCFFFFVIHSSSLIFLQILTLPYSH